MNVDGRHYRTIWTEGSGGDETLRIIDQTALPHVFRTLELRTVDDVCRAIRDMRVRGAGLIGATAAYGVWVAARTAPAGRFAEFMEESLAALRATRPTAGNLFLALERQSRAIAGLGREEAVQAALTGARALADEDAYVYCDREVCRMGHEYCQFECKRGMVLYAHCTVHGLFRLPLHGIDRL